MRVRGCVATLALLTGWALAQAPAAPAAEPAAGATAAAVKPALSAAEKAAIQHLAALFNSAATPPEDFDQAIANFRQQFPHSREMLTVLITAVRFHRRRGDYLPELHYGMEALQLDPNNLYVLSSLAMAIPQNVQTTDLDLEQRLAQAEGYDRQVLTIARGWTITPAGLSFGGNHLTAAQAKLLCDNVEGPAYASLGRIAWIRKQYPAAIAAYRQALTFETTSTAKAQTWYNIGASEAAQGHTPQAQAALQKALGFAPAGSLLYAMILRELQRVNTPNGPGPA
jgi:tetratricopeptide (TPR) repeat protein